MGMMSGLEKCFVGKRRSSLAIAATTTVVKAQVKFLVSSLGGRLMNYETVVHG